MADEHIEIYKRYRPTSWEGLVGQQAVAKSLQSAITANRIPTAYLFSGPRGCGKTSSALLLAKAINCLNPTKNGNPCNVCDVCLNIDTGTQLGVTYLSAAAIAGGGVDRVREIVRQAYTNQPVKRQVLLLDEIHNLSKQAFDALLIPLEDPKMPALFILCTTEINKVPKTIMSRVQSRKFNLIESGIMFDYVKEISLKENMKLSEGALMDAVRMGGGSARDTLSALEEIAETGGATKSHASIILEALAKRELSSALAAVAQANSAGENSRDIAEELFQDLRDLYLTAAKVDSNLIGILQVDPAPTVKGLFGGRGIKIGLDELGNSITQMSLGGEPRIHLDIFVVNYVSKLKAAEAKMAQAK